LAGLREQQGVRLLSLATDLLLYYAALSAVTLTRWDVLPQIDFAWLQRDRLVCVLVFMMTSLMLGRLNLARLTDRFDLIYHTLVALALTGVITMLLVTLVPADVRHISRRELVLSIPVAALFLGVWQYASAGVIARFSSLHRLFYVVGDGEEAKRIAAEIANEPSAFSDAICVSFDELREECERLDATLGPDHASVKSVIICTGDAQESVLHELLDYCERRFRDTFLHPTLTSALLLHHGNLLPVAGIPLVRVAGEQSTSPYLYAKRTTDIAVALLGLTLSLPICIVTAVAIKLTSRGPVFYAQQRLSKGGHPFTIYKFRSMRADVELKDAAGHVLAQRDDPRITPVGRFIRKHRIDEIPQLYNVLVGDMSLVGPRPVWKEFYDQQREELPLFERRLIVRPGLASLSHVLGSYTSTPEDRLRYDLVYINTLSFDVDLRVMLSTVRVVLSGRGAQ
jgi:exopolysaccharide biosynthesis polyprenyl glycosylphosphotransferase